MPHAMTTQHRDPNNPESGSGRHPAGGVYMIYVYVYHMDILNYCILAVFLLNNLLRFNCVDDLLLRCCC